MCKIIEMFFPKPEPTPCPSDILAGVIAIKMISDPMSIKETKFGTSYNPKDGYVWEHRGVKVTALKSKYIVYNKKIGECEWVPCVKLDSFQRNKVDFAPTAKGIKELEEAISASLKAKKEIKKMNRQFEGDMLACEAIKDFI